MPRSARPTPSVVENAARKVNVPPARRPAFLPALGVRTSLKCSGMVFFHAQKLEGAEGTVVARRYEVMLVVWRVEGRRLKRVPYGEEEDGLP